MPARSTSRRTLAGIFSPPSIQGVFDIGDPSWLPDVALFPFHGRKVTVAAIAGDGHDTAGLAGFVNALGELYRGKDVGARRMAHVQPFLARHAVRHVPAVFRGDGHGFVGNPRV